MDSNLDLGGIGLHVRATAELDGWWLRSVAEGGADLSRRSEWPADALATQDGRMAATQADLLLDLEIADFRGGAVIVPWERFPDLLREDIQLPFRWTTWSPLMLAIDRVSELGRADFRYKYSYRSGSRDAGVLRVGYFLRRNKTGQLHHLDEQTFALVDAMDRFNALPESERTQQAAWLAFGKVKGCSAAVGAALDQHLGKNEVVIPSQIALDIYVHPDEPDSISFVPKVAGVSDEGFREAFFRNKDAQGLYSVDAEGGRRVRVVLTERQQEVLERMTSVRRAKGAARTEAERDPARYFEGLRDVVSIEYGPRVVGIGDYPFAVIPANPDASGGFFDDLPKDGPAVGGNRSGEATKFLPSDRPMTIELPAAPTSEDAAGVGGEAPVSVRLEFENRLALAQAQALMAEAVARGDETVTIGGQAVAATPEGLVALGGAPSEAKDARGSGKMYLLVYTNQDDLREPDARAAERAAVRPDIWPSTPTLPTSLRPEVGLKPHQLEALLWLQRCELIADRRGVLLADDMGLGKTLQVLTYLAWRIERGALNVRPEQETDRPPYRPILIVAPLILVENETWVSEMRHFFTADGDIFEPVLVLHGAGVNMVKAEGAKGSENVVGRPLLDADKLMKNRVVITNYETVVNYQHSLAQLKDGRPMWSTVVTDEAQKYKALDTQVALALKAIAADFHIAGTGTPVENRLLDLWNIVDTIQPALLGSASEFSGKYERRVAAGQDDAEAAGALAELRRVLLYGQPHAFLVRRTKRDANLGLPPKTPHPINCVMSDAERELHLELLRALKAETKRGKHLQVLHKLARLYQHPALLRDWTLTSTMDLISESSKLQAVLRRLHEIRGRGEKVIIFARHHDVQQLLQQVLEQEFETVVPIINGTTSRGKGFLASSGATQRSKNHRKATLEAFKTQLGFGAIILSPFVAGIGLTIVEANHVIHYGRWWNPAVENQATDRAYRIGQTREVFVHLPILRDPTGLIVSTFDEKLDALISRKAGLADNFLLPMPSEDANASELGASILEEADAMGTHSTSPFTAADLDNLTAHDFEAAIAALYSAEGYHTILTARGSDGGADVLAIRQGGDGVLIQAKHSASRIPVDERALNDVIAALDTYGNQLRARWKAVIASNAPMTANTVREAQKAGVELLSGERLVGRLVAQGIGQGAMTECAVDRCASFADGIRRAREILLA
jgi:SNF2 family DNA or RNA helicase